MPRDPKYANIRWGPCGHKSIIVPIEADESMRKLAQEALDIQDACNLCGLAQRFAKVILELVRHPQNNVGGTWYNQHPVVNLWIDKFAHLAEYQQDTGMEAYTACRLLADGVNVEWELIPLPGEIQTWEELLREEQNLNADVQPTGPVAIEGGG